VEFPGLHVQLRVHDRLQARFGILSMSVGLLASAGSLQCEAIDAVIDGGRGPPQTGVRNLGREFYHYWCQLAKEGEGESCKPQATSKQLHQWLSVPGSLN